MYQGLRSIFKLLPTTCVKCVKLIFLERAWIHTKTRGKSVCICGKCAPDRRTALGIFLRIVFPEAFKKVILDGIIPGKVTLQPMTQDPSTAPNKKAVNDMLIRAGVLSPVNDPDAEVSDNTMT